MTSIIDIRPARACDWASLKAVRLAALRDAPTAFGVTLAEASANTDAQWRERAARVPSVFVLAFDGGEPVGLAGGVAAAGGEYHLIAMWVRPDRRGQGIADALVDAVKAQALAQGHVRVVLDVAIDNVSAASFYARQGFIFEPHWEQLASHPEITVQKMAWAAPL